MRIPWLRNLRIGARALLRRPLRTALVLQGVLWGVAVSIIPPAVLEGSERIAEADARDQGTDRITVRAQPSAGGALLDLDDLDALRAGLGTALRSAAGYRVRSGRGVRRGVLPAPGAGRPDDEVRPGDAGRLPEVTPADGREEAAVDLIGGTGDLLAARGERIAEGRPLTGEEIRDARPAALLEPETARALFGDEDPLDRVVQLPDGAGGTTEVRVVGLIAPRSETALATDDLGLDHRHPFTRWLRRALGSWGLIASDDAWKRADRGVVVPLGLVEARAGERLDWLILRTGVRGAPDASVEAERILAQRGKDAEVTINMVWPLLARRSLDRYLALNRALFLACLVMGGVVIANMMLLAVLERTREIAIRRTEGATRGDIVAQFLAEALALGVVGSALGVPLGLLLARARVALEPVSIIVIVVPWRAVAVSVTLAVATTVAAGLLPAIRAARLDPTEALRCE